MTDFDPLNPPPATYDSD